MLQPINSRRRGGVATCRVSGSTCTRLILTGAAIPSLPRLLHPLKLQDTTTCTTIDNAAAAQNERNLSKLCVALGLPAPRSSYVALICVVSNGFIRASYNIQETSIAGPPRVNFDRNFKCFVGLIFLQQEFMHAPVYYI